MNRKFETNDQKFERSKILNLKSQLKFNYYAKNNQSFM